MAKILSPEEELARAQQRKNRALEAEKRAREKIRKIEQLTKYEFGGLAVKAGLKGMDLKTIFGVLCFGSSMLRENTSGQEFERFFHHIGAGAWERFEIEKDRKLFKNLSEEETQTILSDIGGLIRKNPLPGYGAQPMPPKLATPSGPSQSPPQQQAEASQSAGRPLTPSAGHAGFDEEA